MASFGAARVAMTLDVRNEEHGFEIINYLKQIYTDNNLVIERF
jgi:hypothetical protein